MTIIKERLLELAVQAGASRYTNRHYLDSSAHTFTAEQLERQYKLINNQVLEEIAAEFDGDVTYTGEDIGTAIRAMKEQL